MATVRQTLPAEGSRNEPSAAAETQLSTKPISTESGGATGIVRPSPDNTPHQHSQDSLNQRFNALLRQIQANRPNEDVSLIRKAWEFCTQQHAGQMRASGAPYIVHPLQVAEVLAEMKLDATAIAAGLLHDAVED